MCDDAEQRRCQPLLQCRQVLAEMGHRRIDAVGHPASQRQSAGSDRLLGQQRMVDAPEAHADDENHRQAKHDRQIGGVAVGAERHTETADPLDENHVGEGLQLSKRRGDVRQLDATAFLCGGDVRRDRSAESVGIDQRTCGLDRRSREQAFDVLVATLLIETGGESRPAATGFIATALSPA